MAEEILKGEIKARIIEVRFAVSGKLVSLFKKKNDLVKKGELIASLDKKILQTRLDKELADYEKERADFEIFNLQKGEPTDEISKYLKTQKQAELNASVKAVEVAKAELDLLDLFSPVEGVIVDDSDLASGIFVTPASYPIKILDKNSFYCEIEIRQDQIPLFLNPRSVTIKISGINKVIVGKSKPILLIGPKKGKFLVEIELQDKTGLITNLEAELSL